MENPAFTSHSDSNDRRQCENRKEASTGVHLERKIGFVRGTSFVIGIVIGSGIFVAPGQVLAQTGSVGMCLIVWTTAGILSSLGALAYAELGAIIPKSGSDYVFFLECFGPMHPFWGPLPAFLAIWVSILFAIPAGNAVGAVSLARYVITPIVEAFGICVDSDGVYHAVQLGAFLSINLVAFTNCYSVSLAARVQVAFTIAKLAAIAIIIVGGFYKIATGNVQYLAQGMTGTTNSLADIAGAFYGCLFAYAGWQDITLITEELQNPAKNLPRCVLTGVAFTTVCYVLINVSFLAVLSPSEMIGSQAVATDWANHVLGGARFLMPLSVVVAVFGSQNGAAFTAARLSYAGGREGHFPRILSYLDVERRTPKPALIFNACMTSIMVLLGNPSVLINIYSFSLCISNGLAMVVLLILKRRPAKKEGLFQTHIAVPIIFLLMSIFLVVMPLVSNSGMEFLYTFLVYFVGFLYYVPFVYYRKSFPGLNSAVPILQNILNVVPSKTTTD